MAIRYPEWNLVPLMRLPREAVGWYFKDAKVPAARSARNLVTV